MKFRLALLVALLLAVGPAWADPPGAAAAPVVPTIRELSPAPLVAPKPADPVPLDVGLYRVYAVADYAGPVTWEVEGTSIGLKDVAKPFTLFGRIHGQPDPGEYDVPAGAVVVWGKSAGVTRLTAYGVIDGKAKRLLVKSFIVGPIPVTPGPVIPGPVVNPPAVVSELGKRLQAAYAKGPDAVSLAGLVRAIDAAVALCNDATLGDAGVLEGRVRAATIAAVGKGKLPAVGLVIGEHLAGKLPVEPTAPLTAEVRAATATAYAEVASALREVKPQ